MRSVDWWSWKCLRCDFKAQDKFTVNPQQCIAEAIVREHIQSHQAPAGESLIAAREPEHLACWWCKVSNTGPMVCNDEQTIAMCPACAVKVHAFFFGKEKAEADLASLRSQLAMTEEVLAERQRLLNLFDCPQHGSCVPFAMGEVPRLQAVEAEYAALRVRLGALEQTWRKYADDEIAWGFALGGCEYDAAVAQKPAIIKCAKELREVSAIAPAGEK